MLVPAITLLSAIALVTAMPSKRARAVFGRCSTRVPRRAIHYICAVPQRRLGLFLRLERPAETGLQGKLHARALYMPHHLI